MNFLKNSRGTNGVRTARLAMHFTCATISARDPAQPARNDFGRGGQFDQHIAVNASPALDNVRPATNALAQR